jgi:hypothetical protein
MTDRTKQIVDALVRAPELVRALKQDPAGFAAQFGLDPALLQSGRRVIHDLMSRLSSSGFPQLTSSAGEKAATHSKPRAAPALEACARGSSAVPLAAAASLTAITGMLAVLGTVSVVGISKQNSDTP